MNWGTAWNKPAPMLVDLGFYAGMPPITHSAKLTIPMKDGWPRQVQALVVGDLAIHEHLDDPNSLQVTHVPTFTFFPVPEYTEEQLVIWCQKVQENLIDDWAELRQLTNLTYQSEHANDCKSRIKEMCSSIE